jgi:cation diffusion facilitator family transporter
MSHQHATNSHEHDHDHDHAVGAKRHHSHGGAGHGHTHGAIDPSIVTTNRGLWAVKWSFVGLMVTALIQVVIVVLSGSVALLADTIHNFGDAATAIPLGLAFWLARRPPSRRFTYGLGRAEDLAGVVVVALILFSAIVAGYESIQRILHPQPIAYLWAVVIASIVGFLGNEGVAIFRIRVGKEIGSAALVADGYHARTDGWTSLAVLAGAIGAWLGYPIVDPIVGLGITVAILQIVWQSGRTIFTRLLDGVEPEVLDEIRHAVEHVPGVQAVTEVRVRWSGHQMHAELNIAVDPGLSVVEGHAVAVETRHQLLHHMPHLGNAVIHVDPADKAGETHHGIAEHAHDNQPVHSHT